MKFRSLFIGIDRYASPLISDLSCSVRDAQAFHALFGDTFGSAESVLLTNSGATRDAILDAFRSLEASDPDDVIVVIGFSGHGSDSHHLVTYDADPLSLDTTAIHLDELTNLFSRIPAANLLLVLDGCFGGGAGAKVFHAPVATKGTLSAEALLRRVSGRGRLILTAGTAEQEAIEDRRKGHGLFTFYVLEALRGAPEVTEAARVPILALVEFVTRMVVQAAPNIRHEQRPTIRGTAEGTLAFPVLTPGTLFQAFFPDRTSIAVSAQVGDLAAYGFPTAVVDLLQRAIPSLNELQRDAINGGGLFTGQHLVVSAPTSSGKTMVGA